MKSQKDAEYRLRLAEGMLAEAEQDFQLKRWRSCVGTSQEAVENASKAVIAFFGPMQKTHDLEKQLGLLLEKGTVDKILEMDMKELISLAGELGSREHVMVTYGDEVHYRDPWQLFSEDDARKALEIAQKAVATSRKIYSFYSG